MPAEVAARGTAPRIRVGTSPVIELAFGLFLVTNRARNPGRERPGWLMRLSEEEPGLRARLLDFWGDHPYDEWGEFIVLAWRAGRLLDDDPEVLLGEIETLASQDFPVPPLESEPPEVRATVADRLRELRESPERRAAYAALLRDFWRAIRPEWEANGRRTAEGLARDAERKIAAGGTIDDVLPGNHLARREGFAGLVRGAISRGELTIVPLGLSAEGQYGFAVPGMLLVGSGGESGRSVERAREQAERSAARFKVLADPTRVAVLSYLLVKPTSITDLASIFGLSQPTVSVHVKTLREAGLLESERSGAQTLYSARPETVRRMVEGALADITSSELC
ncbi:MAG: ArsR/SmtB family transcription factor [Hyphomicrobiales bacterium]